MHHIKNFVPQPKILNMHDAMTSSTMHSKNFKAIDLTMPFQTCPLLSKTIFILSKKLWCSVENLIENSIWCDSGQW